MEHTDNNYAASDDARWPTTAYAVQPQYAPPQQHDESHVVRPQTDHLRQKKPDGVWVNDRKYSHESVFVPFTDFRRCKTCRKNMHAFIRPSGTVGWSLNKRTCAGSCVCIRNDKCTFEACPFTHTTKEY